MKSYTQRSALRKQLRKCQTRKYKIAVALTLMVTLLITLLLSLPSKLSVQFNHEALAYEQEVVETPEEIIIEPEPEPEYPDILYAIAECESGNRQFDTAGNVLRGIVNSQDVGVLQINEGYWLEESIRLGYDIYTLKGNWQMGYHIYKTQGSGAWSASRKCWGN